MFLVCSGICLSMHQPYASLLIKGIKMDEVRFNHQCSICVSACSYTRCYLSILLLTLWILWMQGRVWYSSHRGRLWIAAASKVPSDDEIAAIEASCSNTGNLPFPPEYPTACLLGCVDVLDCLPQDEYREKVCMYVCMYVCV